METKKRKRETLTDPLRTPSRDDEDDNPSTPSPPPPPPATRDWAALPDALLLAIFGRLRHVDILLGAELTCAPWRRIAAGEPALWRRIDVGRDDGPEARADAESLKLGAWMAMARAAVERSAGQCESYRGPGFLAYLAASSPALRRLHITSFFHLPGKESAERAAALTFPSFPVLEGLVLSHDAFRLYMYEPRGVELRMRLGKMVSNLKMPQK